MDYSRPLNAVENDLCSTAKKRQVILKFLWIVNNLRKGKLCNSNLGEFSFSEQFSFVSANYFHLFYKKIIPSETPFEKIY